MYPTFKFIDMFNLHSLQSLDFVTVQETEEKRVTYMSCGINIFVFLYPFLALSS